MNRKRAFIDGIYKEKKKKLCILGLQNDKGEFTSTKSVLNHLRSLFPVEKFQSNIPPIVMKHQLYAFIPERTEVDKELSEMRRRGEIRLFRLGAAEGELAIVPLEDYVCHVEKCCGKNVSVEAFLERVVKKCPDISYTKDALIQQYSFKEENVRELVHHGVLTSRDVGCYWLSIPLVGEFVKAFLFGRRATLQYVRRTKYKEILQSELEKRKLPRKAVLGMMFHIYDLIGADLVCCVETSTGRMLRLQSGHEINR